MLARQFIRKTKAQIANQCERLGKANVTAASDDFSQQVLEISARSKLQIHEQALTQMTRQVDTARTLSPITGEITRRSTRAIKLGISSKHVVQIVVPKMTYEFPMYFPESALKKDSGG